MSATRSSLSQDVKNLQAGLAPSQRLDLQEKQIRILHLHLGEWDDPIRCELYTAYLRDNPFYEALSYVWGNPKIVKPIFVDGRQVQVTINLEAALRALRLCDEIRHMWVDALCINQTDDVEKTHQVKLMAEIYKGTALGLLWLGRISDIEPVDNDEVSRTKLSSINAFNAFDFIRRMAEASEDAHFAYGNMPSQAGNIHVNFNSCTALSRLLDLAWWNRIWTIQEAVLPRKAAVICGCLKLGWSVFLNALGTITRHSISCCYEEMDFTRGGTINSTLIHFKSAVEILEACRRSSLDIADALMTTSHYEAGDPRDKLYALLGLDTEWGSQLSAAVDYSLPPREVFRRMTTDLILLSDSLKPLIRRRPTFLTGARLPTWVHDLSALSYDSVNVPIPYHLYDAPGGEELSVHFSSIGELESRGVFVDEVERCCSWASPSTVDETWFSIHNRWVEMLDLTRSETQRRPYPTGGSYLEAFVRLIGEDFHQDARWKQHDFSIRDRLGGVNFSNINVFAINSSLFITKKGLIGLGPTYTRRGDTVHVLFGGNVPFVLRPVEEGEHKGSYTYVGHCYVQGIMYGEAAQGVGDGECFTII